MRKNEYDQPVGDALDDFRQAQLPAVLTIEGKYCSLERLNAAEHSRDVYQCVILPSREQDWTYMPFDKPSGETEAMSWLKSIAERSDPFFYVIKKADAGTGKIAGILSLMRIDPLNCAIEVGSILYSDELKQSRAATEAQYLLASYVFDTLGYRRYEWKCDSLNQPSRTAALRLGFQFEGIFRNALVYKGRNRDTAWFSVIDKEWPAIKAGMERWLLPGNFDAEGRQIKPLSDCLSPV